MWKNFVIVLFPLIFTFNVSYSMDPSLEERNSEEKASPATASAQQRSGGEQEVQEIREEAFDGKLAYLDPMVNLLRQAVKEGFTEELFTASNAILKKLPRIEIHSSSYFVDPEKVFSSLPVSDIWYVFISKFYGGDFSYFRQEEGKLIYWDELDHMTVDQRRSVFRGMPVSDHPNGVTVDFLIKYIISLAKKYNELEETERGLNFWHKLHTVNDTTPIHWAHLLGLPFDENHIPLCVVKDLKDRCLVMLEET